MFIDVGCFQVVTALIYPSEMSKPFAEVLVALKQHPQFSLSHAVHMLAS
jgi:hypothetical protein